MARTNLQTQFQALNPSDQAMMLDIFRHEEEGRADPVYFTEYHLGLTLTPAQKQFIRFSDPVWVRLHPAEVQAYNADHISKVKSGHKNILNPCNRWGKTVCIAIKHIRFNYYKLDLDLTPAVWDGMRYQTLDISPHSSQIDACFNYIIDILNSRFPILPYGEDGLPDHTQPKESNKCRINFYVSHNKQSKNITFNNNTSFYGMSTGEDAGASLAGKPFGYISYDECVLSHHLEEELFGRIFSRTMDWNAPVDLVATADSSAPSQQYYYHLVRNADKGENDWWIMHGILDDNVFIPEATREAAKEKLLAEDPLKYRQVVLGEFIPSDTKAFDITTIEQVWDKSIPQPLRKDVPNPINADHRYVGSIDWGFADTGDPTIMLFFDVDVIPYKLVYHLKIQGGNPTICMGVLKALWQHFNMPDLIMDTNAMGGVIIKKMLKGLGLKVYDFDAHGGDKAEAVFQLKLLISKDRKPKLVGKDIIEENPTYGGLRSYYIPEMEDQLASYELEDKKLEQDFVAALYQFAWFMHKREAKSDVRIFKIIGNRVVMPQTK